MAEEFGPFELERLLGRGGMAEVFIARRRGDSKSKPLVLKRIRPDLAAGEEYMRRFVLEAQVASRLKHPNLVRFREFGQVGDCRYIAMDQVRGYSMHRLIEKIFELKQPAPLEVVLHITSGILDGLSSMHGVVDDHGRARPMIHRDITPKNVILRDDGTPVIIDFGIAKDMLGPSLTLPGKVIGTARYMSPEHRRAEYVDARADVFSVGVIFFELLAARHPWKPLETIKELLRTSFDPPEIPEQIRATLPDDVRDVMLKSVACDRVDRFDSAREMDDALKACKSYIALGDRGASLTKAWVDSLGLSTDQELEAPVLDHAPEVGTDDLPIMWSRQGSLSTETAFQNLPDDEPVESKILTIPPLPPTRAAALGMDASASQDVSIDLSVAQSRPMWVIALVIGVLIALLGVGSVMLFSGHS